MPPILRRLIVWLSSPSRTNAGWHYSRSAKRIGDQAVDVGHCSSLRYRQAVGLPMSEPCAKAPACSFALTIHLFVRLVWAFLLTENRAYR
jgi:hypothetical protein